MMTYHTGDKVGYRWGWGMVVMLGLTGAKWGYIFR